MADFSVNASENVRANATMGGQQPVWLVYMCHMKPGAKFVSCVYEDLMTEAAATCMKHETVAVKHGIKGVAKFRLLKRNGSILKDPEWIDVNTGK